MKSILGIMVAVLLIATGRSVNTLEQEFTCPIDGTVWKQRVESSASARGLRLDLRQLGDVVDPPTLPQCSKCRFPLFNDRLPAAAIERLRPFVRGADFQMIAAKNPSYFSLAQVQEFLQAPHRYTALSYLRASWQVEDREAVSRRFLEKAHEHFVLAVAEMKPDDPKYGDMAMLRGEVERRLGKWDDAEMHFRELQGRTGSKDARLSLIVAMQLKLIEQRDSSPKALSDRTGAAGASGKDASSKPGKADVSAGPAQKIEELPGPILKLDAAPPSAEQ